MFVLLALLAVRNELVLQRIVILHRLASPNHQVSRNARAWLRKQRKNIKALQLSVGKSVGEPNGWLRLLRHGEGSKLFTKLPTMHIDLLASCLLKVSAKSKQQEGYLRAATKIVDVSARRHLLDNRFDRSLRGLARSSGIEPGRHSQKRQGRQL